MHFIWFIIVGAIVGALGRLLHPGRDPMGWLLTIAIGVVSMLVAALISSGWLAFIIGVIVAVILQARHPASFETLGRVFMPADGQPEYPLEPAGDLAAGHGGREGKGAHDGGA